MILKSMRKGGSKVVGKLFGTFGVRGIFGEELSSEKAFKIAKAFSTFLTAFKDRPVVALGRDTRKSGEAIKAAVVSGLTSSGVDVVDLGVLPTPAIQYACKRLGVDGGISITASHNPPQYIGIKLLEGNGMGLSREKEGRVEEIYFSGKFVNVPWERVGKVVEKNMIDDYIEEIVASVDVEIIRSVKPFVVVDAGNGAGALTLPYILEKLGCKVLSLNAHPSGLFSARNPEPNEENLKDTATIVRAVKADFAVAQDGDADRAVFLDEEGRFIQGDRTFALAAREVLREKRGFVVTTVATSLVIDEVAREFGCHIMRTKVGDLVVTKALLDHNGVVGGEENGGVIFPDFVLGRDGAMATAKIVQAFARSGKRFSELVEELPVYHQIKTKMHLEGDRKAIVAKVAEIAREEGFRTDTTDGTKIVFDDGWVLIRASGTEPIVRIFSESRESLERARWMIDLSKGLIERAKNDF